jgi:hypothetical protein
MTKENFAIVSNEDDLKWKMTSNGRLPQISKVKYLSNYWSDVPQILNLGLYDQRELCKCFKWRRPQMEDDRKRKTTSNIKSVISQQLLVGSSPNFKLRFIWPKRTLQMCQMKTTSKEDDLKWKTTSNIKSEISEQNPVGSSSNRKRKLSWPNKTLQMF